MNQVPASEILIGTGFKGALAGQVMALSTLANSYCAKGDYEAAVPLIEETREIIRGLDDTRRAVLGMENHRLLACCWAFVRGFSRFLAVFGSKSRRLVTFQGHPGLEKHVNRSLWGGDSPYASCVWC